jgi:hypothetical protein
MNMQTSSLQNQIYEIPKAFLRISGFASILSGIFIMGLLFHPKSEEPIFGTNTFWIPSHGAVWLGLTLALLGWIGVYIVQASKAGKFGAAAFTITMLGTGIVSWIFSSDVLFVPTIAKEMPSLFQEIFSGSHVFIGVASVLIWILGYVLFGISIIRANVFPKWSGILLIIGSLIIPLSYAIGLPVRVIGVGAVLMGIAQIWLGYRVIQYLR